MSDDFDEDNVYNLNNDFNKIDYLKFKAYQGALVRVM